MWLFRSWFWPFMTLNDLRWPRVTSRHYSIRSRDVKRSPRAKNWFYSIFEIVKFSPLETQNIGSGPKWTAQNGESGRSRESGRSVQKWTVLSQTGRSFEPKWTVRDDSGRSLEPKWRSRVKVDGQSTKSGRSFRWIKVSKWTVQKYQSGRSEALSVNAPILTPSAPWP